MYQANPDFLQCRFGSPILMVLVLIICDYFWTHVILAIILVGGYCSDNLWVGFSYFSCSGSGLVQNWLGACDFYRCELSRVIYIVGSGISTGFPEIGAAGLFRLQGVSGKDLWNIGAY